MPNLYDFPAPLQGVNQGLQSIGQTLMQAQQAKAMQQQMQGQGMQNRLYEMQLGEAQKEQQNKEGLVSQLKPGSQTPVWKQAADYWQSKGDSQKAFASMQIGKVEEELNANPSVLKYADMITKIRKADKTGNLLRTMWPSIVNQFPEPSKGVNIEDIIKNSKGGVTAQPIPGTNLMVLYDEDGQRIEIKERDRKKIDKTIDLGDKVRIVYTDGTTKDEKKGVSPSTDIQERRLTAIEKKEAKKEEIATKKEVARLPIALQKAEIVSSKIDEALSQIGFTTTGLTGTVLGKVPGTKAYDLENTIDTIKANIGFNELAEMRAASPTGGALGQIAVRELEFLQAALGSLDKGQSREQLVKTLNAVKQHYANWKATMQGGKQSQEKAPSLDLSQNSTEELLRMLNAK